jgi:UDPglucose 6-dehydrogenase
MKVCVQGLWHLGTVIAACLASGGHSVTGLEFNTSVVENLIRGNPPLYEPDLAEMLLSGLANSRLTFTTDVASAVTGADIVWIAYDTPVDDEDRADVEYVIARIEQIFAYLQPGVTVLISSQLPVGTTKRLEIDYAAAFPLKPASFACSPENLRLGKALQAFTNPDRVVVGIRSETDQKKITQLLQPFTDHIEWMSVESAEMTKHAMNAFLATSVIFINEIAAICEKVGADAKQVERGLKSDTRIGSKAYLAPGGPFAGGTLARDVNFLAQIGQQKELPVHLFRAITDSNNAHKGWVLRRLVDALDSLDGKTIAVWGLTYKPETDTLRRSLAVELCSQLACQGAQVQAYDPRVQSLPVQLAANINLSPHALDAVQNAHALVVSTEWPDFLQITADEVFGKMALPWVLDANRFLSTTLGIDSRFHYLAVGKGNEWN